MFTVYILYSDLHHKIYIGYTSNIEQRLLSIAHCFKIAISTSFNI
ncbi:MAG: GIY-YIG nuclease family protein [Bacteroidetes bacterium]|nr:GIY-YIG nuclease family protein [Bacteroidota bacterium]